MRGQFPEWNPMPRGHRLPNAIRALTMDAVQQAGSGHPGAPMGMADIAHVLWAKLLKHSPQNPDWIDRDRFVLSNGHGSMLLYSLLHLTGYGLDLDEIRNFRQLGSKTPGHPEYGYTPGIETTTGPLGQGLANAVGMAIAEKILAGRFNTTQHQIINHYTYVFVGDGCLMEGVSHEVASLAGTLGLGKLICIYDDNGISIDGKLSGWFTDDTAGRFKAYGWHVIDGVDGHDQDAVQQAILAAQAESRPSLLCCKTAIGYGAPNKEGTAAAHGSPLGAEEISLTRARLDWADAPFEIPEDVYAAWDCRAQGAAKEATWQQQYADYAKAEPQLAAELQRCLKGELPANWDAALNQLLREMHADDRTLASRSASGEVIARLAQLLPEMLGGSADLSGSNCTLWADATPLSSAVANANYIYYGVREFGMTAITNGIALHGGLRPFCGTFLIFMEYARNAVRMAALMGVESIFVYSHDSIGQGEDGPTHQPIEQLANLRGTPNMSVWRPCDAVETVVAWKAAIERRGGPTALVFSRQGLPHLPREEAQLANIARGGYIIYESVINENVIDERAPTENVSAINKGEREHKDTLPDVLLLATGSEVSLALASAQALATEGLIVRVISMPSVDTFEAQEQAYKEQVLPDSVRKRVAIEASHVDYWRKWVGLDGMVIGMDSFGESAPGPALFQHFGFTVDKVTARVKTLMRS